MARRGVRPTGEGVKGRGGSHSTHDSLPERQNMKEIVFLLGVKVEPGTSHMRGEHSATKSHAGPAMVLLMRPYLSSQLKVLLSEPREAPGPHCQDVEQTG